MRLPTAKELNLWDYEVEDGMAISVFPFAQEHAMDPLWWDQGGRDPLDQKFIFRMDAGPARTEKLKKIVDEYPLYGLKMYEKCAEAGRVDLIRELLVLGASLDIPASKGYIDGFSSEDVMNTNKDDDDNDDDDDDKDKDKDEDQGKDAQEENNESHEANADKEQTDPLIKNDDEDDKPMATMTPGIIVAAYEGHFECVKVLVTEGNVDINARDHYDTAAITNAAVHGHIEIVRWLLSKGASLSFNREGKALSDLQAAVKSGNVDLLKMLLGDEQTVKEKCGLLLEDLWFAASSGKVGMVAFLLEYLEIPTIRSHAIDGLGDESLTILSDEQKNEIARSVAAAVQSNSLDMVELLLSNLTKRRPDGLFEYFKSEADTEMKVFEALEDAMSGPTDDAKLFEIVWESIVRPPQSELDQSQQKQEQNRARVNRRLISACSEGCPKIVQLLIEKYGAEVNHVSYKYFTTPLGRAAESSFKSLPGRLEVVKYLLQRPEIDIHLATGEYCNGPTALALTMLEGPPQPEMIRLLLEHGGPVEEFEPEDVGLDQLVGENDEITLYIVTPRTEPRFPVRFVRKEWSDHHKDNKDLVAIELNVKRPSLDKMIANLQVRKRDSVLQANDPKQRQTKETGKANLSYVLRERFVNVPFNGSDGVAPPSS